jgi:hypothetical protein
VEIMHFSGLGGIRSYIEFATNCVNSGVVNAFRFQWHRK